MSTFIKNSQNIKVNIQSSSPQNTTEKMKTDVNVCVIELVMTSFGDTNNVH